MRYSISLGKIFKWLIEIEMNQSKGRFLVLCFLMSYLPFYAQEGWSALLSNPEKKVLVAAHRGDWQRFPENSIPGVMSCINMGIDIVEVDVQETMDGKFILMHDETVNRTTNGKGKVANLLFNDIIQLKLKNKKGELTSFQVPSLDTILKLCKNKIVVNLDKSSGRFEKLFKVIDSLDCGSFVILKDIGKLKRFESLKSQDCFDAYCMPILTSTKQDMDTFIQTLQPPLVEFILKSDTSFWVSKSGLDIFQKSNTRIWYNALFKGISGGHVETENAIESWKWFIEHHAYVIQTDYPFHLMTFLIQEGLHSKPINFVMQDLSHSPFSTSQETKREGDQKNSSYHTVREGDSLSTIARLYNMTMNDLLKLNKSIHKESKLHPGDKIKIK